jgi:uncharacterized membrane protein (UPF0127 family)
MKNENKSKTGKEKRFAITNPKVYIPVIIVIALAAVFIIINPGKKENTETEYMFRKDGELTFTDSLGNQKAKLNIQIANTTYDRELGLMFRKHMEPDNGMLFIFPVEEPQSFWMENTFIPLDMIFVNHNKKIVTIHRDTKILSEQSYPSTAPAIYVIEVNAGYCLKHNIEEGDKIEFMELSKGNK